MTPEEVTKALLSNSGFYVFDQAKLAEILKLATLCEREACAKICEKYQLDFVARDIRKRGEPDASTALQSIQQQ
jgi:hypothetical protein